MITNFGTIGIAKYFVHNYVLFKVNLILNKGQNWSGSRVDPNQTKAKLLMVHVQYLGNHFDSKMLQNAS